MKLGWKYALVAWLVWSVAGCLLAPLFGDAVDPYQKGRILALLSPLIGGLGFLVGRSLESR
jgi:hypothetical protein